MLIEDSQEDSWSLYKEQQLCWQRLLRTRHLKCEYLVPTIAMPTYVYKHWQLCMDKMNREGGRDPASWLIHGESHRQATLFAEEACRINRIVHLKNYLKFQYVACQLPMCLRCFKEWLLSLKLWGSVNHTGFRLWTWHLVRTYLPSKLWCHFWPCPHPFPKWREKLLSERLQNPDQFPLVLGPLLLLQPRATTVV